MALPNVIAMTNFKPIWYPKIFRKGCFGSTTTPEHSEDEQGINTLYLACGFLKWYESEKSDVPRQAPLILIPIKIERKSANARFKVKWSEEEITTNLSIQAKIKTEFGLEIPDIENIDDFNPAQYLAEVQKVIADKKRWEVVPDGMVVWFFSFAKFLMYKDLEEGSWPDDRKLSLNKLIGSLLQGGFENAPSPLRRRWQHRSTYTAQQADPCR